MNGIRLSLKMRPRTTTPRHRGLAPVADCRFHRGWSAGGSADQDPVQQPVPVQCVYQRREAALCDSAGNILWEKDSDRRAPAWDLRQASFEGKPVFLESGNRRDHIGRPQRRRVRSAHYPAGCRHRSGTCCHGSREETATCRSRPPATWRPCPPTGNCSGTTPGSPTSRLRTAASSATAPKTSLRASPHPDVFGQRPSIHSGRYVTQPSPMRHSAGA